MGLGGSRGDEKNGVFQTISNDFAPPPPTFWSSAVSPLQSPPLFSWAFCSHYCLLPSSPSAQRIAAKTSNCVILIYIHSLSSIIVAKLCLFQKRWPSTFCVVLLDFFVFPSPPSFSSCLYLFFFFELHAKSRVYNIKKVRLPNVKFQKIDTFLPLLMDDRQI